MLHFQAFEVAKPQRRYLLQFSLVSIDLNMMYYVTQT